MLAIRLLPEADAPAMPIMTLMRLISHKFSDLINLDVKEGRRLSVKRGNYRDFASMIPVEYVLYAVREKSAVLILQNATFRKSERSN